MKDRDDAAEERDARYLRRYMIGVSAFIFIAVCAAFFIDAIF